MSRNTPELVALALFAEAIGDPTTRRDNAADPLELMKQRMSAHGHDFGALEPDVQQAFTDLFGDMTHQELRMLGRLQAKMVELDPDQTRGLTESVEVGSHATVGKL